MKRVTGFVVLCLFVTFLAPIFAFAENNSTNADAAIQAEQIAENLNYDETKILAKINELKAMLADLQMQIVEQKKSAKTSGGSLSISKTDLSMVVPWGGKTVSDLSPDVADVDGDGIVNNADMVIVFSRWGVCLDCAVDFNKDGVVNTQDVVVVSLFWTGLQKK
mgnify:CR=1 FL=1